MKKTLSSLALALAATSAAAQNSTPLQSPCCAVDSCTSVSATGIQPIPGGFFVRILDTEINVRDPKVEVSQDQAFHIGMGNSDKLICLFVPSHLYHDAVAATEVWDRL